MMWRRLLLIIVLLAGVLVAGVVKIRRSWFDFEAQHRVEMIQAEPEPARTIPVVNAASPRADDWTEIPAKNVFSFDRNDVPVVTAKETTPQQQLGPKPLLYGTMSIGSESVAMLSPGQGRASRPVKIGESIENWQLVDIQKDSVIMTANGARTTIAMNDTPQQRDHTRTGGTVASPAQSSPVQINQPSQTQSPTSTSSVSSTLPKEPPAGENPKGHWIYTPFGPKWVPDNP